MNTNILQKVRFEWVAAALVALGAAGAAASGCGGNGGSGTGGSSVTSSSSGMPGCPTGQQMCGDVCVDTQKDPANCGACTTACKVGEVCSQGMCALSCGGGTTECGSLCINTSNDPMNCGMCNKGCAPGEVCSQGMCSLSCVGGTTLCNGICVDTGADPKNCGMCGKSCNAGELCSQGNCTLSCGGGSTECSGLCVDTQNDPSNCGMCAVACNAGEVCSLGKCGLSCVGGSTKCGNLCVDTQNDPNNCGGCGTTCGAGEVCSAGMCGLSCVGGSTKCGNVCVDTQHDPKNCGMCGTTCSPSEVCSQGACALVCTGGTVKCGNLCVDTLNDPANCGGCGIPCGATQVCSMGGCINSGCSAGQTSCNGVCADLTKDPYNCGVCGTTCNAGQACSNSSCVCAIGRSQCGNACVELSSNSLNCGACGNACAANKICAAGVCVNVVPGNGKAGGGLSGVTPPKIGVLSAGGGGSQLTTLLQQAYVPNTFTSVTFIDTYAGTPTLAQIQQFDAVAVWTYLNPTTTFGDNLADYLESGGGVVLFDYESQESGSWQLKGRYETQYTMMGLEAAASIPKTITTLGTILEPGSPLMVGVNTLSWKAGALYPYHLNSAIGNGGIVVANWADGLPCVIRGNINGHTVVELNFFGGPSTYSTNYGWDTLTDGATLIKNSLNFVIPPLLITTVTSLDLGAVPVFKPSNVQTVTYTNTSASPQTITAIGITTGNVGDFSATPGGMLPATIPPMGTFTVNVVFTPSDTGFRAAMLNALVMGAPAPVTTLLTGSGT